MAASCSGALDARLDSSSRERRSAGATVRLCVAALLYASICMLFLISPQRLHEWGIDYESSGGSLFAKMHPGTWAAFAALGLHALCGGDAAARLSALARWRGLMLLFAAWVALLAVMTSFHQGPFTPLVDTFLLPMVLFALLTQGVVPRPRRLALLVHALLAANGVLAIIEYSTGWRLTPFWAGNLLQVGDWRSTAFIGHPLANASITGAYILALALGGGRDLPAWARPAAMALQIMAMAAFGGRTALVLTLAILGVLCLMRFVAVLRGARIRTRHAALFCVFAPLALAALFYAIDAGFFDRLLDRFVDDNGSAHARLVMFRVFDMFPLRQILFEPDQAWLTSLQYQEGINYGIESFWLSFILQHGLIMSLTLFVGLAAFCFDLALATRPQALALILYYFAVASTSVSLSAKTTSFALFIVVTMILLRPAARRPDRLAAPGSARC